MSEESTTVIVTTRGQADHWITRLVGHPGTRPVRDVDAPPTRRQITYLTSLAHDKEMHTAVIHNGSTHVVLATDVDELALCLMYIKDGETP